jgi:hypothetical protein
MDTHLIGELIRLRYKLLWAKTRSRNGRIALFFAGYLLLIMLLVILTAGGVGAGIVAVRAGKGYVIAASILAGLFLQALLATVVLGFGVNAVFADTELRRYPLKARERRFARHFLGILDPFWFLILALELGLVVGLYVVGPGSLLLGFIAVILLLVSNYLLARVIALLIERLAVQKGGSAMLLGGVLVLCMIPAAFGTFLKTHPHALDPVLHILSYTPPAAAAAAILRPGFAAIQGLGIMVLWLAAIMSAIVALERKPAERKIVETGTLSFDSPWERIGALVGPAYGPLVAQWLRFYSRNNRFRTIYPLSVPLIAFLMFTQAKAAGSKHAFASALGVFAIAGFMGTAQMAVNQFGYLGGGLRRYFLLPADPAAILRAGSYCFLCLSAMLIPVAAIVLVFMAPVPLDGPRLVMFLGAAVTALFLFHGLALWSTIFGPRRANFYSSFGNDLSLAGNIVLIGGVLMLLFLPRLLDYLWPPALDPANWWVFVLLPAAAAGFYFVSLGRAGDALRGRRERLLAIMEGRS